MNIETINDKILLKKLKEAVQSQIRRSENNEYSPVPLNELKEELKKIESRLLVLEG